MRSTGQGTDLATIVGSNIRRARLEHGWKQRELARQISEVTSNQRISEWERGTARPTDASLLRLAEILGHDFAWFFIDHESGHDGVAA